MQRLLFFCLAIFLNSCANLKRQAEALPAGPHKQKALALSARHPRTDAAAMKSRGCEGLIMSYGGILFPIGIEDGWELPHASFQSIKSKDPEFLEIRHLLEDPAGAPTWPDFAAGRKYPEDRTVYQKIRSRYAVAFNRAMLRLDKKQSGSRGGSNRP